MKDYLTTENMRNKQNAELYTKMIHKAFGDDCAVLVGHHLTFEKNGELATENEIPSADCLMFDHEIMVRLFGNDAMDYMCRLAATPVEQRDKVLARFWEDQTIAETEAL